MVFQNLLDCVPSPYFIRYEARCWTIFTCSSENVVISSLVEYYLFLVLQNLFDEFLNLFIYVK